MIGYVGDAHAILSAVRDLVDAAQRAVVLQMYLFAANGDQTLLLPRAGVFPYADTVADWLIEKKRACPACTVVVILDSNTPADASLTRRRGTLVRERLRRAGVIVLTASLLGTRFDPRRRRLVSAMNYHLEVERGPLESQVARQNRWQVLHNVEDHRKNVVIDAGRAGAVTSHNFFDPAWDWHENLFWLTDAPAQALWRSALAAIDAALCMPQPIDAAQRAALEALRTLEPAPGRDGDESALVPSAAPVPGFDSPLHARVPPPPAIRTDEADADGTCELLEHEAIRPRLLTMFDEASAGDALRVATTYFSDLETFRALERAAARGVDVRVLVDSIDALTLPPVPGWLTRNLVNHAVLRRARRLVERRADTFALRIHDSRGGAMMHLKTAARLGQRPMLVGGQANYTPNSFSGAWLETDLVTTSPSVVAAFESHFEHLWQLSASRPLGARRGLRGALGERARSALLAGFAALGLRP